MIEYGQKSNKKHMASIEFGKCDICGKETALTRTYFKYRIGSCECCDSKLNDGTKGHFEVVHHCNECIPHLPTVIHPLFKAMDGKPIKQTSLMCCHSK